MNPFEQEILDHAARQLSESVDREMLWKLLEDSGWTRVAISRLTDNRHAIDIVEWVVSNCHGDHKRNGREFLFEREQDAVMFTLRWQ